MELSVFTYEGKETSRKVILPKNVFGITPDNHAIYMHVKHIRACQRQGTHKAKERSEVSGSTKKIQRQKGTGNARKGSIKSNILRGGGRTFGPKPRDYSFKLNKKQKTLARKSALAYKAQNKQIRVLEDFTFDKAKTKSYLAMLHNLAVQKVKTLLILSHSNNNLLLSARNLPQANVVMLDSLNTYDVLNAQELLISESALKKMEEKLA